MALAALMKSSEDAIKEKSSRLYEVLVWPGKPGYVEIPVRPLTAVEKERFEQGQELYLMTCGACHQPHGLGQEGLAPPLLDSDWVVGAASRLARIALQGVRGTINVKGKNYELDMPPLGVLNDDQIAQVLTYIRREWNHGADPITPEFVQQARKDTAQRQDAWTEKELLKIN